MLDAPKVGRPYLDRGNAGRDCGRPASYPSGARRRQRIVVDGYGQIKTPPDLAIITYTVRGEGSASDAAVRSMTAQGARIELALRQIDPAAEPLTGDVKVTPVRSDDCKEF